MLTFIHKPIALQHTLLTRLGVAVLLGLGAQSMALGPGPSSYSRTMQQVGGRVQAAWFICDALNAKKVVVGTLPNAFGRLQLTSYSKMQPGHYQYQTYALGQAQVGGGSTLFPLSLRALASQRADDELALANLGPPSGPDRAFTPPYLALKTEQDQTACRWLAGTRVSGFTPWRSFVVTESASGVLTYQTFDFKDAARTRVLDIDGTQRSSVPSIKITGGTRTVNVAAQTFRFENAGYMYILRVPTCAAEATLSVLRDGRVIQRERVTGYTLSLVK